jgi:signal transduction histidine kinase/DNA-binding response OmpR family regulator
LPVTTAKSLSPRSSATGARASSPRLDGRVLVVDDSDAKRYLVAHALRMAGMDVYEAASGHQALAAMDLRPEVVVLDVRLPDLSGFEVCRCLKADPATAAIPVLYVSALLEDAQLEQQLFDDGADGYIPQPIEPKHLVAQTWALVRMRRAEQARERERDAARAERELLLKELRVSEQRLADIQATTAAFAHALRPSEVADAVVAHGLRALDAYAGAVCLLRGESLWVLSETGYTEDLLRAYRELPLSRRTPMTDAARTGEACWVESPESLEAGWPEMTGRLRQEQSCSWVAVPMKDGGRVVGVLGLSFNTARRFGPQERAHLESLCQLCAQALERARLYEEERLAKEEARRLAALEQQFLGVVSHDLRNPLQAISLAARTLQRMAQPSAEQLMRVSGRIASSADTMGRMVSDLLDFTRERLGGGVPLERMSTDLTVLCREVLDEFALTHPSAELQLEADETCHGFWDGGRMRQVLSNLVSNALRHARKGTAVRVRARALAGEAELSVTNEGDAIPAELLPVLFEPFRRGMPKYRPAGSLGLGLFIVRQVVEGHAGRVEVSTGETGTTFTVRVPTG